MYVADRRAAQRGFTMIELAVVIALVAMMSLALNEAVVSTHSADQYLAAVSRATQRGQNVIRDVSGRVSASRRLFQDDAVGQGYLQACDLSRFPSAPDARLPIFDVLRDLGPDGKEASHTGNILLLVSDTAASTCVADPKEAAHRVVDTHRMVAIYPTVAERVVVRDGWPTRDMVVWQSVAYPSLQQILEVGDEKLRQNVVKDLVRRYGFTHAWEPGRGVQDGFHRLHADGRIDDLPEANMQILEDPDMSDGPRLVHADVRLGVSDPSDPTLRSRLTGSGFEGWQPHGFEVKVVGTATSRKVWIRVVVQAAAVSVRRVATYASTVIVDARDY